jgi:hypothetical protein
VFWNEKRNIAKRRPPPQDRALPSAMSCCLCPGWTRHPAFIVVLILAVGVALAALLRALGEIPGSGVPSANAAPGGPRRALRFSPVYPVSGFLPADPTRFASWAPWQPRTFSFDVNDGAVVGTVTKTRSGYTGVGFSAAASVDRLRRSSATGVETTPPDEIIAAPNVEAEDFALARESEDLGVAGTLPVEEGVGGVGGVEGAVAGAAATETLGAGAGFADAGALAGK